MDMKCDKKGKFDGECPLRELLSRLADKWSVLLIVTLVDAPGHRMRFSELKRSIDGISQRMLTTTLKNLERDGLLKRYLYPEVPPRVEYELTSLGKSILTPMKELVVWIEKNWSEIQVARKDYDERKAPKESKLNGAAAPDRPSMN